MRYSLTLVFCFLAFCTTRAQTKEELALTELQRQLFTKCFDYLNQGSEILEKYPSLQKMKFCSILECLFLLSYKEEDVQLAAKYRLQGIATRFYNEGQPIYLTSGLDSFASVLQENQNLADDNGVIYLSVGDCIIPNYISEGKKIFNDQTENLIRSKVKTPANSKHKKSPNF